MNISIKPLKEHVGGIQHTKKVFIFKEFEERSESFVEIIEREMEKKRTRRRNKLGL